MKNKKKSKKKSLQGKLQLHFDGYGFVVPTEKGHKDVFIPPYHIKGAMNGDLVEAIVTGERKNKKLEGEIIQILERAQKKIVGHFRQDQRGAYVFSEEQRKPLTILIPSDKTMNAKDGQAVVAEITQYPEKDKKMKGEIIQLLGKRGELNTELEIILAEFNLLTTFPEGVIKESELLASQLKEDFEDRVSLKEVPIVTIDGENAKDFDDGIFVERQPSGFKLFVAIADVSHYVTPHTQLNKEAYSRATSVYFPHRCIPMLPEILSNDLCSLKPHRDRLSFVAEIHLDKKGEVVKSEFYKAVIKSFARLTYTQVKRMLIDQDIELRTEYSSIVPHLETAFELFELLRAKRLKRGSIDFDLPEPEFILDVEEGIATSIVKAPRTKAHMLIEEFMIAANEAVAEYMEQLNLPMIYRVHDRPDPEKIDDFKILVHNLGHTLPIVEKIKAKNLSSLVNEVRGQPYERLINTILLRSLKQAVYSTENIGHFGLASESYTHFTSPIRRYPDLVIHRLVHQSLFSVPKKSKKSPEEEIERLAEIAAHCSKMERRSMQAEWAVRDLQVCLFMKDKIDQEFEGVISSVTKFGFFVELLPFFVEGLVHLRTLTDDLYQFNEKHHELIGMKLKKKFKIGMPVRIRLTQINIEQRKIDFTLID